MNVNNRIFVKHRNNDINNSNNGNNKEGRGAYKIFRKCYFYYGILGTTSFHSYR